MYAILLPGVISATDLTSYKTRQSNLVSVCAVIRGFRPPAYVSVFAFAVCLSPLVVILITGN